MFSVRNWIWLQVDDLEVIRILPNTEWTGPKDNHDHSLPLQLVSMSHNRPNFSYAPDATAPSFPRDPLPALRLPLPKERMLSWGLFDIVQSFQGFTEWCREAWKRPVILHPCDEKPFEAQAYVWMEIAVIHVRKQKNRKPGKCPPKWYFGCLICNRRVDIERATTAHSISIGMCCGILNLSF